MRRVSYPHFFNAICPNQHGMRAWKTAMGTNWVWERPIASRGEALLSRTMAAGGLRTTMAVAASNFRTRIATSRVTGWGKSTLSQSAGRAGIKPKAAAFPVAYALGSTLHAPYRLRLVQRSRENRPQREMGLRALALISSEVQCRTAYGQPAAQP